MSQVILFLKKCITLKIVFVIETVYTRDKMLLFVIEHFKETLVCIRG